MKNLMVIVEEQLDGAVALAINKHVKNLKKETIDTNYLYMGKGENNLYKTLIDGEMNEDNAINITNDYTIALRLFIDSATARFKKSLEELLEISS